MTAERWTVLIAQQRSSGMSIEAFCRRHHLAISTFFAWRGKLKDQDAPAFVELTREPEPCDDDAPAFSPIELVLPGGVVLHVREGFDAAVLRQVVEALS